VPPSGAPGFAGDHAWDKGFSDDYFANERVERKSVRLEGRREMTSSVLEMELVDLVRIYILNFIIIIILLTDDLGFLDSPTPPCPRPPSAYMDTSL